MAGFKRLHRLPSKFFAGAGVGKLSVRQQYIEDQSRKRFNARDDAFQPPLTLPKEIGSYGGFRLITEEQ